jgi:hypothetical protein
MFDIYMLSYGEPISQVFLIFSLTRPSFLDFNHEYFRKLNLTSTNAIFLDFEPAISLNLCT